MAYFSRLLYFYIALASMAQAIFQKYKRLRKYMSCCPLTHAITCIYCFSSLNMLLILCEISILMSLLYDVPTCHTCYTCLTCQRAIRVLCAKYDWCANGPYVPDVPKRMRAWHANAPYVPTQTCQVCQRAKRDWCAMCDIVSNVAYIVKKFKRSPKCLYSAIFFPQRPDW